MVARRATTPLRSAAALLLVAASLAASGCGSGTEQIDDPSLPYSFSYPSDFEAGGQGSIPARELGYSNETIVAKENGLDLVAVRTQTLAEKVDPRLVPRVKQEVARKARRDGRVRSRRDVRVDGLDGVALEMAVSGETGVPLNARWIYAAKDRTLFWISCQWRTDRTAVLDACDQVVRTFKPR